MADNMSGQGRSGIRHCAAVGAAVALRLALGCAVVALAGFLVLAPSDDASPRDTDTAAASGDDATPRPAASATRSAELAAVRATPTAAPIVEPVPEQAVPGGDDALGAPVGYPAGNMPETVGASADFLGLRDSLAQEIADYSDDVGGIDAAVTVTDLQDGQTTSVNGNTVHRTGCTINMFALLAIVSEFQAGKADPAAVVYNVRKGIGGSYPPEVRNFLQIVFGSYYVGMQRAQQLMASWGMTTSYFYHVPYYGDGVNVNRLTALETNMVWAKLYHNELFPPEWTEYTLRKLHDVNYGLNYMIPGRLPNTATVSHKIGYYADTDGWVNNDAGVVRFTGADGKTKAYAITYLSQQAPTEAAGYTLGAVLSRMAWNYMAPKYGAAIWPAAPGEEPAATPTPRPTDTPLPATPSPTPRPTQTPHPVTPSPPPTAGTPSPTIANTMSPTPTPTPRR
jgi:hypothetical protein